MYRKVRPVESAVAFSGPLAPTPTPLVLEPPIIELPSFNDAHTQESSREVNLAEISPHDLEFLLRKHPEFWPEVFLAIKRGMLDSFKRIQSLRYRHLTNSPEGAVWYWEYKILPTILLFSSDKNYG
jgi:hypothetical protein